jgi:hypothetical protein
MHNALAACRESKGRLGASPGGLCISGHSVTRTIVYIDGFNLYYRALKGTSHKWLDIAAMSQAALPADCRIEAINYYTAHISGRVDPTSPKRQHAYLRAIATLPKVTIHYGNFLVSHKWAGLVQPPNFRPPITLPAGAAPQVAYVWKTEEKASSARLSTPPIVAACSSNPFVVMLNVSSSARRADASMPPSTSEVTSASRASPPSRIRISMLQ